MTEAKRENRAFRFGVFELDAASGELRREGKMQPRLRSQALQILVILLERPKEVVTRDELRQGLWPADTFVDFDHGLNTAINQLRSALDDSASNPRFIQTLPRRGYRFIAPVETAAAATAPRPADYLLRDAERAGVSDSGRPPSEQATSWVLSDARELPSVSGRIVNFLFSLIQLMYFTFYVVSLARLSAVERILADSGNPIVLIIPVMVVTAAVGIPIRLYLLSAAAFGYRGLSHKFRRLFPFLLVLDELWALAPFLLVRQIGIGLALGATAALLYLPFSQRSLLLMGLWSRRRPD